jgi:general secretion pathway protein E
MMPARDAAPNPGAVDGPRPLPAIGNEASNIEFESGFATFLIDQKITERSVLDRAGSAARKIGERFDRVLTKLGLLSEADLATALSRFLSIPLVSAADVPMEPVLADISAPDFIRRNKIMPLAVGDGKVTVGTTDPFNQEPVCALAYLTGLEVIVRIVVPADFDRAFDAG